MLEFDPYYPVARLEPEECVTERVGKDVVMFDEEPMQYHTMHELAFQVMSASDGTRSVDEIATLVFGRDDESCRDLTGQALLDLMDSGLIVEDPAVKARLISRRLVGKAAAALLLGGVGLPLVRSITAPEAASADTPSVLPTPVFWLEDGGTCHVGDVVSVCKSGCCCNSEASRPMGFCFTEANCGASCN